MKKNLVIIHSTELRFVPENWSHPKDEKGLFLPLRGESFSKEIADYKEEKEMWNNPRGFKKKIMGESFSWVPKEEDEKKFSFEDWHGKCPEEKDYMPEFSDQERTHCQLYETITEGTPITPVMGSSAEVGRWIVKHLISDRKNPFTGMSHPFYGWTEKEVSEKFPDMKKKQPAPSSPAF